jgi:hypothetical protein
VAKQIARLRPGAAIDHFVDDGDDVARGDRRDRAILPTINELPLQFALDDVRSPLIIAAHMPLDVLGGDRGKTGLPLELRRAPLSLELDLRINAFADLAEPITRCRTRRLECHSPIGADRAPRRMLAAGIALQQLERQLAAR